MQMQRHISAVRSIVRMRVKMAACLQHIRRLRLNPHGFVNSFLSHLSVPSHLPHSFLLQLSLRDELLACRILMSISARADSRHSFEKQGPSQQGNRAIGEEYWTQSK